MSRARWQQVLGGQQDYIEFKCDCGRVTKIGVGEKNWGEIVDEKGETR